MTNNENQENTIFTEEELIKQILNLKSFLDETKVQLEQAQQRITNLEKEKTDLTTERDNALDALQTEKTDHENTQEKLKTTEFSLENTQTDRDNLQTELNESNEERNKLKDEKTKKSATMEKAKIGMDELTAQVLELRIKAINLNKK